MKAVTLGAGEMPVVIDPNLPKDYIIRVDGRIHVGSMGALQRMVDDFNRDWILVQTSPPCLVHQRTGETVDLEGDAEPPGLPPRCPRCGVRHA